MKKTHILETDLKTLNGESLLGDGDIEVIVDQSIDASTLTPEQLDYIRDKQLSYGSWYTTNIGTIPFTLTDNVTRMPIFRNANKEGNLVNNDDFSITLKKGMLYRFEVFISCLYTAAGLYSYKLINSDTGDIIKQIISDSVTSTVHRASLDQPCYYFNFDEDTRVEIRPYITAGNIATLYSIRVQIVEISSMDVKLANFKINGKSFDENNNIDLEGRGTMSNPKLGEEILTEFRHPISGKPIYEKAFDFGALPNNTTKNVAHNIDYEWMMVDQKSSYTYDTPTNITSAVMNGNYSRIYISGQNITCISTANVSSVRAIVVLRYTKASDTAQSPVRLTGGFTLDDAIGALTINGKNFDAEGNVTLEGLSELTNPVMNQEVLTEHRCPLNGKRRWMKLINFGALPNNTTKSVLHGADGVENPQLDWENSKVVNSSNTYFSPAYSTSNGTNAWRTSVNTSAVTITTYSDRRDYYATITILYTKASDSVDDPVRLVGGPDYIVSPNGTKYKINVDDEGNLSTTQID